MLEPLPHGYPFRFVERTIRRDGRGGGEVLALVTANGRSVERLFAGTPSVSWPPARVAEAVAQAALLIEGGDPGLGKTGFLAGLDEVTVDQAPAAGEAVTIAVSVVGRLGPVVRFEGRLTGDAGARARALVTVRQGQAPTSPKAPAQP